VIFIDTGPLLARYLARDKNHRAAAEAWLRLSASRHRLFTSSFVVGELATLLTRWAGYEFAAERAARILASPRITVLQPDEEDQLEAVSLLERFAKMQPSYTDCISFAVMRNHMLRRAFTFDERFQAAGFEVWK
jgi:predicted nucleic acid-binding protein